MTRPQPTVVPPQPAPPERASRAGAARGGAFLGGAAGRLLPASVPFRYFGAATAFHLAGWLVVLLAAPDFASWRGGPGWPLAALHLLTLGTLAASAIGAGLQLLPVATLQPVRWPWLPGLMWWVYVPGVILLAAGMGVPQPAWLALGAAGVIAVLVAFGALLALNLWGARSMAGVLLHGWSALAALALLLVSATLLVSFWLGRPLLDRDGARALHLATGVFGFMGLLALGLSSVLLPMFALARVPAQRRQLASGAAAATAVALACAGALAPAAGTALRAAALLAGAFALGLHLRMMRAMLASAMRPDLGLGGRLIHGSWAALALALAAGAAALATGPGSVWALLFGLAAVGGWLASFLFGVLQRILPFLASMHASGKRRRAPTAASFVHGRALAWHAVAHALALALLAAGLAASSAGLVRAAGAIGSAGAAAFALFFAILLGRLRRALAAPTD